MKTRLSFTLAIFALFLCASVSLAQSDGVPWRAVDGLGRSVDSSIKTGTIRDGKKVGIFYFLWLSEDVPKSHWSDGPYDLTKLLAKLPRKEAKDVESSVNDLWPKGEGTMMFWGEPLFGYYATRDPWVIRRHVQLLVDAGVDFLVFDTTNNVTYPREVRAICDVMLQMRAEGGRTPQITFMINTNADETAQKLWDEVYNTGKYDALLLQLEGKPLLVGDPAVIKNEEIRSKLTLRRAHWPLQMVNTEKAWHWEAAYPQPYGYASDPKKAEQVNVSVAQNLSRQPDAHVENMSSGNARGRSFHNGKLEEDLATDLGRNFAEQWERAYELDPDFVMVTGWNEWIAGRWTRGDKHVFVDQFNREYSRDIEPMKGGHFDNYYLQMVEGIRRYKGSLPTPKFTEKKTIDVDGDFSQWNDVALEFGDWTGDVMNRDFPGAGGLHYVNDSGRNDLVLFKATRDDDNFYFYLKTKDAITPSLPDGLCLLINSDNNLKTGFIGGDILIGAKYDKDGVIVAKYDGRKKNQWKWKKSGSVRFRISGNELMLVVPYETLGLQKDKASFDSISFKWLDNFNANSEIYDIYTNGDVAPESRFFFSADE